MDTKTTEKISIGGLRFSCEQIQLGVAGFSADLGGLVDFLEQLAGDQVNLPFLCLDTVAGPRASVCLSREDFEQRRQQLIAFLRRDQLTPEWIPSTGSLTLFPHQSRLKVLGALLELFGKNGLPLYSLCSSLSALVVNTDFHGLNHAAQAVKTLFELPGNHSPFRQQMKGNDIVNDLFDGDHSAVVETAAVYWEPVIKIYGSSIKKDLLMTTAYIEERQLSLAGSQLQAVDCGKAVFQMALMQPVGDKTYKLGLLYDSSLIDSYRVLFSTCNTLFSEADHRPAELLYLHGPHFHDRYGVASAALRNLQKNNKLFAAGCAGTSIYLVTPSREAQRSADALEKIFIVPRLS